MKLPKILGVILLAVAFLAPVGPVGCKASLDKQGVYDGDQALYSADKAIVGSTRILRSFVKWEYDFRATLPVEVSRAADKVRSNADQWVDSAIALRDAYAANPSKDNKLALENSVKLLQTALAEATKYMAQNQSPTNAVPR